MSRRKDNFTDFECSLEYYRLASILTHFTFTNLLEKLGIEEIKIKRACNGDIDPKITSLVPLFAHTTTTMVGILTSIPTIRL